MKRQLHNLFVHLRAGSLDTTTDERGFCKVCGEPTGAAHEARYG